MPAVDFDAMLAIADALEARERLNSIQDATVSSGWAKQGTVSKHLSELERQKSLAPGPGEEGPREESISATTEASLRGAGVQVVRVNRDG